MSRIKNEAKCLEFIIKNTTIPVPKVLAAYEKDGSLLSKQSSSTALKCKPWDSSSRGELCLEFTNILKCCAVSGQTSSADLLALSLYRRQLCAVLMIARLGLRSIYPNPILYSAIVTFHGQTSSSTLPRYSQLQLSIGNTADSTHKVMNYHSF